MIAQSNASWKHYPSFSRPACSLLWKLWKTLHSDSVPETTGPEGIGGAGHNAKALNLEP